MSAVSRDPGSILLFSGLWPSAHFRVFVVLGACARAERRAKSSAGRDPGRTSGGAVNAPNSFGFFWSPTVESGKSVARLLNDGWRFGWIISFLAGGSAGSSSGLMSPSSFSFRPGFPTAGIISEETHGPAVQPSSWLDLCLLASPRSRLASVSEKVGSPTVSASSLVRKGNLLPIHSCNPISDYMCMHISDYTCKHM